MVIFKCTCTKYSTDLTSYAKNKGKLDPMIGRESRMKRLMILEADGQNNPCPVGRTGAGKTAIISSQGTRLALLGKWTGCLKINDCTLHQVYEDSGIQIIVESLRTMND